MRDQCIAATILLAFLLAGCAEPVPSDAVVETTSSAVVGTVLDQEDRPVQDAMVSLMDLERQARTDDEGRFRFDEVDIAGAFLVVVQKPGYVSASTQALVFEGYDTSLELRLTDRESLAGIIELTEWQGELSCRFQAGPADSAGDCYTAGRSDDRFEMPLQTAPRGAVVEMAWQQSPGSTGHLRLTVLGQAESGAWMNLGQASGTSPLQVTIDGSSLASVGDHLRVQVDLGSATPPDTVPVGTIYDQEFTILASTFYQQAPPDGYSALP